MVVNVFRGEDDAGLNLTCYGMFYCLSLLSGRMPPGALRYLAERVALLVSLFVAGRVEPSSS